MTPSSTPGSPSPDDSLPWSEHDPHRTDDATRPMPPVSRIGHDPRAADTGPAHDDGPGTADGTGHDGVHDTAEDWSWYDDETQHTRPMPPVTAQRPVHDAPSPAAPPAAPPAGHAAATGYGPAPEHGGPAADPATRRAQQSEEFGGLQLVPGFYGWLSAMALTWLLLALAGLVASATGLRLPEGVGDVVDDLAIGSSAAWSAVAVLGAVQVLAFLGGGYTAGRMARFSGAAQGVSVWLWSLFGRSVATVAGLVWADTVGLAPVGVSAQSLIGEQLVPGLLAVAAVVLLDLLAAVLGGVWGVRYHRRVDRWGATAR